MRKQLTRNALLLVVTMGFLPPSLRKITRI